MKELGGDKYPTMIVVFNTETRRFVSQMIGGGIPIDVVQNALTSIADQAPEHAVVEYTH